MTTQYVFELLGTGFFAISGALAGNDKSKPDWFGTTFIGFVTAIGGGSLRDILLGSYPLVWINDVTFIYAIIIGVALSSLFFDRLIKIRRSFFLFDTFGIAFFAVLGADKALNLGVDPLVAAIMGMFSAVMGGVMRDVLTNEIPIIFQKEIYATACFAGALLFVVLMSFNVNHQFSLWIAGAFIVLLRLLAVKFNMSLPLFYVKKDEN